MTTLDTRPMVVNVKHYGGDTLVLHVKVPSAVIGGRTFFAQVRHRRTGRKIAAQFTVIPTSFGADIVLHNKDILALTARGKYIGYWDVQLAAADGSDPVTTLAHGEMRLDPDVTRTSA
jgi:hypothetical protein